MPTHRLLAAACLTVASLGCSPTDDEAVVRLVDRADRAAVLTSPLLEGAGGNEEDSAVPGLVRRGRLLPVPRVRFARPPFESTYLLQDALAAPAPTHLAFEVDVPEGARLTFSYAVDKGTEAIDPTTFEVRVRHGDAVAHPFSKTIYAPRGLYWRDGEVDLSTWAGRKVELHLVTSSEHSSAQAFWGNPVIDRPRSPEDPPNVLLIGIDTLRADRLSSYGYPKPTTPNIDALADDGIRFDQAISAANWTAPSFASIFTGLPPGRHSVATDPTRWKPAEYDAQSSDLRPLADTAITLAERFRGGGWRTEAIAFKPALYGVGLDQGFERWFNMPSSRRLGQKNLDRALAWLEANHQRRFFLFVHFNDPHQPFNQPPSWDIPFGDRAVRNRLFFRLPITIARGAVKGCDHCTINGRPEPDFVTIARDLYDGEVAYTDHLLGRLIDGLKRLGVYEDTVIALLSDHGELLFERPRYYGHGGRWLTDDLVRVPWILKPHSGAELPRGKTVSAQVRTTDLLPTVVELAGMEPPAATADSRSLLADLRAGSIASLPAFSESPRRGAVSVRTPKWKYVVRPGRRRAQHELHDLEADPDERHDVAAQQPEQAAELDPLVAAYYLRSQPGPYLLVVGDDSDRTYAVELGFSGDGSESLHLLGLPPGLGDSPRREQPVAGRIVSFVQLELARGDSVQARLFSDGRPVANRSATLDEGMLSFVENSLDRLLELDGPAIYFLHGAPGLTGPAGGATTHPDQLEELRALGYID